MGPKKGSIPKKESNSKKEASPRNVLPRRPYDTYDGIPRQGDPDAGVIEPEALRLWEEKRAADLLLPTPHPAGPKGVNSTNFYSPWHSHLIAPGLGGVRHHTGFTPIGAPQPPLSGVLAGLGPFLGQRGGIAQGAAVAQNREHPQQGEQQNPKHELTGNQQARQPTRDLPSPANQPASSTNFHRRGVSMGYQANTGYVNAYVPAPMAPPYDSRSAFATARGARPPETPLRPTIPPASNGAVISSATTLNTVATNTPQSPTGSAWSPALPDYTANPGQEVYDNLHPEGAAGVLRHVNKYIEASKDEQDRSNRALFRRVYARGLTNPKVAHLLMSFIGDSQSDEDEELFERLLRHERMACGEEGG